jgi:hypothetical protein
VATIELNDADLKRIQAKIAGAGRALAPSILTQEINRTADQIAVATARRVRADVPKLPYATIRRRLRVVKATGANPSAEVRVRRVPINLARFGARHRQKSGVPAVSTGPGITAGPFRHAFIIRARFKGPDGESVTTLVVERTREGGRPVPRLPLTGRYGSSVLELSRPHLPVETATGGTRLADLLAKRIDSELGKGR